MMHTLDKLFVLISSTMIFIALIVLVVLILNGTFIIVDSIVHYYQVRDQQKAICLAQNIEGIYWKDETFMGLGPDGSYGCFMAITVEGE